MDLLNDHYPLYSQNPEYEFLSPEGIANRQERAERIRNKKRKKKMPLDEFCSAYSDDLWYLWNVIREYTEINNSKLLDTLDYSHFCVLCYQRTSK